MVALGHVVFTAREHVIALAPRDKGMLGVTLRYPYEIRKETDYFGTIPDVRIPKDMLDLAIQIIKAKAGHFQPKKFEDHYESAIRELVKRKQRGEKLERLKERPPAEVINLMDALRQSAAGKRDVVHTHQKRSAGRRRRTPLDRSTVRSRKAR